MKFFDELKRLNPRDPGGWPWPVKIGALVIIVGAIVAAGAILDWKEQWQALDVAKAEEVNLKKTFEVKKSEAVNLDLYKQQLKEIEEQFGALLKQLPNKAEMEALLIDINQAGLGRGLQFELFRPAANENFTEFYAELPITLKLTGNYHDLGAFASDVSQLPRIVTLNDIAIQSGKDGMLVMDAVAKTFRYLDEEEVAKQRKAAQAAKAPKGKAAAPAPAPAAKH